MVVVVLLLLLSYARRSMIEVAGSGTAGGSRHHAVLGLWSVGRNAPTPINQYHHRQSHHQKAINGEGGGGAIERDKPPFLTTTTYYIHKPSPLVVEGSGGGRFALQCPWGSYHDRLSM